MPRAVQIVLFSILLAGCQGSAVPLSGRWILSGPGVLGAIDAQGGLGCSPRGVHVTLYGPSLLTEGAVAAHAVEEKPGLVWLDFPVRTAAGDGQAAMRLQGHEAMVPLGARPGELELRLTATEGWPEADPLAAAQSSARAQLDAATEAWDRGAFRLLDEDDALVGEVRISPNQAPVLAVYDATWWTGGLVQADRQDDGPDIVLAFPVQPSVRGEEGQLRLNVPLSLAIVPADSTPTDLDRVLRLVPGVVSEQERRTTMATARQRADDAERDAMLSLGSRLAVRALSDDGRCLPWQQVAPELADILVGYDVAVVAEGDHCLVDVQPTITQHRRRLRARIGPHGLVHDPAHASGPR
ncbi:MAG: hypothetical protein GXP62_21045 [Oligoflexia bacterium]|nr:hypothetical protein [Oligoflexia bacterium]